MPHEYSNRDTATSFVGKVAGAFLTLLIATAILVKAESYFVQDGPQTEASIVALGSE